LLDAEAAGDGLVTIDMGLARLDWREIPLAKPMDTLHLEVGLGPLADGVGVNIGNPHAVFFVADAESIDIAALGPVLERHPLFPERANIEVASLLGANKLRMRVWERGVGITRACGTGACAGGVRNSAGTVSAIPWRASSSPAARPSSIRGPSPPCPKWITSWATRKNWTPGVSPGWPWAPRPGWLSTRSCKPSGSAPAASP